MSATYALLAKYLQPVYNLCATFHSQPADKLQKPTCVCTAEEHVNLDFGQARV
jgi:hypothetical protein